MPLHPIFWSPSTVILDVSGSDHYTTPACPIVATSLQPLIGWVLIWSSTHSTATIPLSSIAIWGYGAQSHSLLSGIEAQSLFSFLTSSLHHHPAHWLKDGIAVSCLPHPSPLHTQAVCLIPLLPNPSLSLSYLWPVDIPALQTKPQEDQSFLTTITQTIPVSPAFVWIFFPSHLKYVSSNILFLYPGKKTDHPSYLCHSWFLYNSGIFHWRSNQMGLGNAGRFFTSLVYRCSHQAWYPYPTSSVSTLQGLTLRTCYLQLVTLHIVPLLFSSHY